MPLAAQSPTHTMTRALDTIGVTVFERGWLSSNNILIRGNGPTALVDSGYSSHAPLTLQLVEDALQGQALDLLLNTHLHSDHCGGNALLQANYPGVKTRIPPGHAHAVAEWDPDTLSYTPTGQECPQFVHSGLLEPGDSVQLGSYPWEVHGAKGHDPHSIILFQPESKVLISADALWNNGFGVVFPELDGDEGFEEVAETLDLIEALKPSTVIPGHGPIFSDVNEALARARSRLDQFKSSPDKHRRYALKVMVKFRLLEWQAVSMADLLAWCRATPYVRGFMPQALSAQSDEAWLAPVVADLARSGSLRIEGKQVINC